MRNQWSLRCALGVLLLAAPASAQVKKQEIIKEVQAAFQSFEKLSCSALSFHYAGELTEYANEKPGAILVYFGYDQKSWIHNELAYFMQSHVDLEDTGEITRGVIALNAYDYDWSIGQRKDAIDIQSAVLHMIPQAIGFYVGPDTATYGLGAFINYNQVMRELHPLHKLGARFSYFQDGTGCVKPDVPPICGKGTGWTVDAGLPSIDAGAADAGQSKDSSGTVKEAGASSDAKSADASAADAGMPIRLCVLHSHPENPSLGKPYHWPKQPIDYYIFIPDKGRIPGGVAVPHPGDGVKDAGLTSPDAGPGSGGDDGGCCRVSYAGAERATPVLALLLGLGLLIAVRRQRRR